MVLRVNRYKSILADTYSRAFTVLARGYCHELRACVSSFQRGATHVDHAGVLSKNTEKDGKKEINITTDANQTSCFDVLDSVA